MITDQHRKEQLSVAYISAVTAHAGHIFETAKTDYGVDGTIRHVKNRNGRRVPSGYSLDIQLKATVDWSVRGSSIIYDLEAKTYNDLVDRFEENRATPMILVVLCLPRLESEWLKVCDDALTLRQCCYWCHLNGSPTTNSHTIRITMLRENLFTPSTLERLLQSVVDGVDIT